jgi:hypothetical protein
MGLLGRVGSMPQVQKIEKLLHSSPSQDLEGDEDSSPETLNPFGLSTIFDCGSNREDVNINLFVIAKLEQLLFD